MKMSFISDQRSFEIKLKKQWTTLKSKNVSQKLLLGREEFDFSIYLEDFFKIKELGRGGFGKVYLGEHFATNKLYAIKQMSTQDVEMKMHSREAK